MHIDLPFLKMFFIVEYSDDVGLIFQSNQMLKTYC